MSCLTIGFPAKKNALKVHRSKHLSDYTVTADCRSNGVTLTHLKVRGLLIEDVEEEMSIGIALVKY